MQRGHGAGGAPRRAQVWPSQEEEEEEEEKEGLRRRRCVRISVPSYVCSHMCVEWEEWEEWRKGRHFLHGAIPFPPWRIADAMHRKYRLSKANAVNEEDPERDRATQV